MAEQLANLAKGDNGVSGDLTSTEGSYSEEIVGSIIIGGVKYTKYKRTVYCGSKTAGSRKTITQNDLNPVKLLGMYGTFGYNPTYAIPWSDTNSSYLFNLTFNTTTHLLELFTNAGQSEIYVTIEYCK